MIGIFDSGRGGENAAREILKISPGEKLCLYKDTENAPYGTKTRSELVTLVKRDIDILREKGADRILMACCTASTVHSLLPREYREIALPILAPTAMAAVSVTKNRKIGVIATNFTVGSHAFKNEISHLLDNADVTELAAQPLVRMAEDGKEDGNTEKSDLIFIERLLLPLKEKGIDTLILGCTHFGCFEKTAGEIMGDVNIINSAKEGALEILRASEKITG